MRNLLSLAAALLPAIAVAAPCPFHGPVIRVPKNLRLPAVEAALKNFTVTLDSAVAGEFNPGFLTNETSFSILLADSKGTMWEYHHKAPTATKGTKSVNAHSQYWIGSVTKVITDLLMLRLGVDLNNKITKYVPDLAKGKGGICWDEITLRDLGSHLSGIGPDYVVSGIGPDYVVSEDFTAQAAFVAMGFPPIKEKDYPLCGVPGLQPEPCTRKRQSPPPSCDLHISGGLWYLPSACSDRGRALKRAARLSGALQGSVFQHRLRAVEICGRGDHGAVVRRSRGQVRH